MMNNDSMTPVERSGIQYDRQRFDCVHHTICIYVYVYVYVYVTCIRVCMYICLLSSTKILLLIINATCMIEHICI